MTRSNQREADLKLQASRVVDALARHYPDVTCALHHRNAFELLVATILSAQCTDVRVNMVTPALFARYPDAKALSQADPTEVEPLIHATGFFRAKASNLVAMARGLVDRHHGEVPRDLDALTTLPGVGRKTANVVLGTAYGIASGVVVDTHVKRLAMRLGLTESTDPTVIERDLIAIVPSEQWVDLSHRLIVHGRQVCAALRPRCTECALAEICPRRGVTPRGELPGATRPRTGKV
jgi:endonuclease-3